MSHFESLWVTLSHFETFESLWVTLSNFESPWVISSHFESLWVTLSHFESLWVTLSNFESLWVSHCESGLVWSGLVWSGLVWSGLVWSDLVWDMFVLVSSVRCQLVNELVNELVNGVASRPWLCLAGKSHGKKTCCLYICLQHILSQTYSWACWLALYNIWIYSVIFLFFPPLNFIFILLQINNIHIFHLTITNPKTGLIHCIPCYLLS